MTTTTTTTMMITQSVDANDLGVEKFSVGDMVGALQCFRQALVVLNNILNLPTVTQTTGVRLGCRIDRAFTSINDDDDDFKDFFVWKEPILFHLVEPEESEDTTVLVDVAAADGIALFASTILFNIALVYHTKSIKEGVFGAAKANRAMALYQRCLQQLNRLQLAAMTNNNSNEDTIIDMSNNIHIAVSTNMAHILRQWSDPTNSDDDDDDDIRRLLSGVHATCNYYIYTKPDAMIIFSPKDMEEFCLNQFFYIGPSIFAHVA